MKAYTLGSTPILLTTLLMATCQCVLAQQTATLAAEGVINTDGDQYGPMLTSDAQTLYFTERVVRDESEQIMVSMRSSDSWTTPKAVPFSGDGYDKEPYLSPDGTKLFFASRRPVDGADRDFDIWFVEREEAGWGSAKHLAAVNSDAYDNYPAVASNGNLYFSSKRDTTNGDRNDLWVSRYVDGHYTEPEPITELNTRASDADPFIDPDERFMIISSTREGGEGSGDLYISYKGNEGWSEPVNLGPKVNSDDYEYTPFISADGKHLYFSRGWGSIFRIDWQALEID